MAALPPLSRLDLEHVLAHAEEAWRALRGARLFVTGGTGFFGAWLLETFCHANDRLGLGASLLALTRSPRRFAERMPHLAGRGDLRFQEGDVRDFPFPDGTFSHVIHAGATSGAPVPPLEMFETVVNGTRRVLEFAVTAGAARMLFVSSGAVYGRQPQGMERIPETHGGGPDPSDPASAYGEGKRGGEQLCGIFHRAHGLGVTIARGFAFLGPHLPLDAHFAAGNFIRDALAGGPIRVKDGGPYRSYLYAADLAVWLWVLLVRGVACRPYNVGSEESLTVDQLAETIASMFAVEVRREGPPKEGARYVPGTERARRELGLGVTISLREGLARTAAWHRGGR